MEIIEFEIMNMLGLVIDDYDYATQKTKLSIYILILKKANLYHNDQHCNDLVIDCLQIISRSALHSFVG